MDNRGILCYNLICMKGDIEMIIDSHAHIFPDRIAARAADGISSFYNMRVRFDGSVGSLLEINRKAGVDRAIVQSVATVQEQVHNINDFVSQQV